MQRLYQDCNYNAIESPNEKDCETMSVIFRNLIDCLYPPVCLACHDIMNRGFKTICQSCFASLQLIPTTTRCR